MKFLTCVAFLAAVSFAAKGSTNTWFQYRYTPILNQDYIPPKVLVDQRTKTFYYLESDGRHITAFSPAGRVIWHVEPGAASNIPGVITGFEFDTARPRCGFSPNDDIVIGYNCGVQGEIRKSDGVVVGFSED